MERSTAPPIREHPVPVGLRLQTDVLWEHSCLTGQCPLGSLAADALCEWADDEKTLCLIPTRFLGGGLRGGAVDFAELAEVLPPHPLASVTLSAKGLRKVLAGAQAEAWRQSCAAPYAAAGWQVSSDVRFAWAACGGQPQPPAELRLRVGAGNASAFALVADEAAVRVLTLAPALPLLIDGEEAEWGDRPPTRNFATSAQHALGDFLRSRSPLDAAAAVEGAAASADRIGLLAPAAGGGDGTRACAPSSCASRAPALGLTHAATALGVSAYDEAHLHAAVGSTEAGLLLAMLVLAALVGAAVWHRARRRDHLPPPMPPPAATPGKSAGGLGGGLGFGGIDGGGIDGGGAPPTPLPPPVDVPPFGGPSASPSASPLLGRRSSAGGSAHLALLLDPEREPLKTGGLRVTSQADLGV